MATAFTSLVAQQLIDCRPSPTLEVNRSLVTGTPTLHTPGPSPGPDSYFNSHERYRSPSPSPDPSPVAMIKGQQAPPPTPSTKATPTRSVQQGQQHQQHSSAPAPSPGLANIDARPAAVPDHDRTPVKKVVAQDAALPEGTSSPKGAQDIFSLTSDSQLSAMYKFVEEIGYGNWVSCFGCRCSAAALLVPTMLPHPCRARSGRSSRSRHPI